MVLKGGGEFKVYDRVAEVESLLDTEDSLRGRVWRLHTQGQSQQEIAESLEIEQGPVYQSMVLIDVVRKGDLPKAPSVAKKAAGYITTWIKKPEISIELREELQKQEEILRLRASDQDAVEEELSENVEKSEEAWEKKTPGVYVYTLPHYLRHPIDEATGKTLLKVGHSSDDPYYRVKSQGRITSLPEDPILLRVYPAEESSAIEREFHAWLLAADHEAGRTLRGGTEWFVTSTAFLDRVARSLNLDVIRVNDWNELDG